MNSSWRNRFRLGRRRAMTCEEVGTWLQHYLDAELDERRAGRLAAHLEDCKRCGLESATYEQIKHSLANTRPAVSADAIARLRDFGERIARGDEPVQR